MRFRRFVAIIAAVGVLVLASRLILGLGSIPGGLRLIMVLGLAAVVGLAIADSGPRRRQAQIAGPRFVVAARPTGQSWRPTDARSLPKPWRDSRMPRELRAPLPGNVSRTYRPFRRARSPPVGSHPLRAAPPRDGGERASSWRRLP